MNGDDDTFLVYTALRRRAGTVSGVSVDVLSLACDLARSLDAGEVASFRQYADTLDYHLPRNAHSRPEIQTVMAQHKAGRPCTPVRTGQRGRGWSKTPGILRGNMYEDEVVVEEVEGLDAHAFSYTDVHVARSARERCSLDDDISFYILLGCAVRHGHYHPGREGAHIVSYAGHSFILTERADTVIGYTYRPRGPRRPQQHVEVGEPTPLSDTAFDPYQVLIRPRVIETFAHKHGTDDDEADREIRDFLADAYERNKYRIAANRCHVFTVDGYTVWVSPDGREVTKYTTVHIERTPRDVRDGVPSRFSTRVAP